MIHSHEHAWEHTRQPEVDPETLDPSAHYIRAAQRKDSLYHERAGD